VSEGYRKASNQRFFLRFKLRTLFIVVALVAMALAAYPRIRRFVQWYETRKIVSRWAETLERKPDKAESFTMNSPIGGRLAEMTVEATITRDEKGFIERTTIGAYSISDPKRFFVIPPGKWVDDIDQVIEEWDKYRAGPQK
jgi:hypothetical protein